MAIDHAQSICDDVIEAQVFTLKTLLQEIRSFVVVSDTDAALRILDNLIRHEVARQCILSSQSWIAIRDSSAEQLAEAEAMAPPSGPVVAERGAQCAAKASRKRDLFQRYVMQRSGKEENASCPQKEAKPQKRSTSLWSRFRRSKVTPFVGMIPEQQQQPPGEKYGLGAADDLPRFGHDADVSTDASATGSWRVSNEDSASWSQTNSSLVSNLPPADGLVNTRSIGNSGCKVQKRQESFNSFVRNLEERLIFEDGAAPPVPLEGGSRSQISPGSGSSLRSCRRDSNS
eukprot:TRINITY_DN38607_c1_g1_i2.p1 TRINITY_DN38607_c1_g1~~TRINITY_DN38607_c1_g1_i2.p1  ORF type:complete len:287 (+),score=63.23 TRINITY_DN38607_c1_g1_i2:69-929(+)